MTLKRRQFLTGGATAFAAGAVASPAVAQGAPEIKWRLTSSFPRILDTIFGSAQMISRYVAEATDNRFQIQTFPAGEIVPGLQALDAVQNGSVECAQTPVYFYFGKDPTLAFGTGVPFGLNARLSHSWWHFGGGAEIINETLAKFNSVGFVCGNSGCQMGGFFRKELNDLEDLKGLKFRIGGLGGQVLSRLGIVPQQIAPGDVYPALEKGTIDAAEFVGPYDDEKLGFHKVAKYYYYPGWWEGGAMLHLVVNTEQWNKLPKTYQRIVQNAAEAGNNWMLGKYDAVNAPALRRLVAGGAVLKAFPAPIMEASYKAAHELYDQIAGTNPGFKKALDSYMGFRAEQLPWWSVGELSFDAFMARMRARA
jgi:TRAP-type mannitol/chloroaromatic compound transport system substrate-binding protein